MQTVLDIKNNKSYKKQQKEPKLSAEIICLYVCFS